jgi:hypothetical protein
VFVRGLLIALSGFLFIFSPGLPMGLLARRVPAFKQELIVWGLGLWLAMLLPSFFVQSLLRQALLPGGRAPGPARPADYVLALAGTLLTAVLVQVAMYFVLRRQAARGAPLPLSGLPLGFGVTLLAEVFAGLGLVGAGVRLMFGGAAPAAGGDGFAALATASALDLALALVPLLLFRPALVLVGAARGLMVGRAVARPVWWLAAAAAADAAFAWGLVALQLAGGAVTGGGASAAAPSPALAAATIAYLLVAGGLAAWWVANQLRHPSPVARHSSPIPRR